MQSIHSCVDWEEVGDVHCGCPVQLRCKRTLGFRRRVLSGLIVHPIPRCRQLVQLVHTWWRRKHTATSRFLVLLKTEAPSCKWPSAAAHRRAAPVHHPCWHRSLGSPRPGGRACSWFNGACAAPHAFNRRACRPPSPAHTSLKYFFLPRSSPFLLRLSSLAARMKSFSAGPVGSMRLHKAKWQHTVANIEWHLLAGTVCRQAPETPAGRRSCQVARKHTASPVSPLRACVHRLTVSLFHPAFRHGGGSGGRPGKVRWERVAAWRWGGGTGCAGATSPWTRHCAAASASKQPASTSKLYSR